jgi:hypothetical protein
MKSHFALFFFIFASAFVAPAFADDDSEVVRAQAYISLGDELANLGEENADKLSASLQNGVVLDGSGNYQLTTAQQAVLRDHDALVAEAQSWYLKVFGRQYGIADTEQFSLPLGFQFLNRDAYEKWTALSKGFLSGANRRKNANLYAVNADFKSDIIAKTSSIVAELQRLDSEARRIDQEYRTFRVAQSDASGNAIGIDTSKLQAENYSLQAQTQLQQYTGQGRSLGVQLSDEAKSVAAKDAIVGASRELFRTNWSNLMDVDVMTGGAPEAVTIPATSDAYIEAASGLNGGDVVYIEASGRWQANGVAQNGCFGPGTTCYLEYSAALPSGTYWNWLTPQIGAPGSLTAVNGYPSMDTVTLGPIFNSLINKLNYCDPNGYFLSASDSVSSSTSTGQSLNGGLSYTNSGIGINIGGSISEGEGYGRGTGQAVTIGFRTANAELPDATLGSLVGRLTGVGLSEPDLKKFLVGSNIAIKIPEGASNVSIWLIQNDVINKHSENLGSLNVKITKSVSFASYVPAFWTWFNKKCTVNPVDGSKTDCGFASIIDSIAYETNPQLLADTALANFINTYPSELQPVPDVFKSLMSGAVKSALSLAMANRDLELALAQSEQTSIAKNTAEASADIVTQQINATAELVGLIQKQKGSAQRTTALIAAGREFYENELSNIEKLRNYVTARLHRYMQISHDSYNYRYLDNLKLTGSAQPGYEGDFYSKALQSLIDRAADDDATNDAANPNRGFLVYQLPANQLAQLKETGKTSFSLNPELFYCQGYGIEDQVRIHIEKVGYLLDINPANEQNFFSNVNIRRMALKTTHGNSNSFHDLQTKVTDYYIPSQSKEIYGYSTRVLTDHHSDYAELGDSNLFQRRSFQNTSYVADWTTQILDMTNYNLEYLDGVKFVIYFSSTEASNGAVLKTCTGGTFRKVQRGHWN